MTTQTIKLVRKSQWQPATTVYPPDVLARYGKHLRAVGVERPVVLICETVNKCSLNCMICAYGEMERPKEVMSMERFRHVLEEYSSIGGGHLSFTPVVGDIFMDPLLWDRLAVLDEFPAIKSVSVVTNAVGLARFSDEQLKGFLRRLSRVYISVYGMDDEEFFTMTRKRLFPKFVGDVKRLVALSESPSQFMFGFRLLKTKTEEELKAWVRSSFGVDAPVGYTTSFANWGIFDTSKPLPHDATWMPTPKKDHACLIPLVALQVHSNGNVSICPCDDFEADESLSLGNIDNQPLRELLMSEKHQRFWQDFTTATPRHCQTCSFYVPLSRLQDLDFLFTRPTEFMGG
jgi:radical SAM protein with 4Fe4S-binding SPASM domain